MVDTTVFLYLGIFSLSNVYHRVGCFLCCFEEVSMRIRCRSLVLSSCILFMMSAPFCVSAAAPREADMRTETFALDLRGNSFDNGAVVEGENGDLELSGAGSFEAKIGGVGYSPVFDPVYYAEHHADLMAAYGYDPAKLFKHFQVFGMKEGRRACASFDVKSYRFANPDLRARFADNYVEYFKYYLSHQSESRVKTGVTAPVGFVTIYNGVDYAAVYDRDYYISHQNLPQSALKDEFATLEHYVNTGMAKGLAAISSFDPKAYRNRYPDLRKAFRNDWKKYINHYLQYGLKEKRQGTDCDKLLKPFTVYNGTDYADVYDYEYYIAHNSEAKALAPDDIAVLALFVTKGIPAGETGSASFDMMSYRNRYLDLRLAFGLDYAKYYQHYITHGKKENRSAAPGAKAPSYPTVCEGTDYRLVYDFEYLVNKNATYSKYKNDPQGALKAFVTTGMPAGVRAIASFDVKSYYNRYQDLRNAYRQNWKSYYLHYIRNGFKEKRVCTGVATLQNPVTVYKGVELSSVYSFADYTSLYADVRSAYGKDDYGAINHFATTGILNGRTGKKGVTSSSAEYKRIKQILYPNSVQEEMLKKAQSYSSNTRYLILVNCSAHSVGIYSGSQGNWSQVRYMRCGDGKESTPTVKGTFTTIGRTYYFDSDGGVRCFYATRFYGHYLLHSVLYDQTPTPQTILDGRVGVGVSHGCVRLLIDDAKWIYDNIPLGTKVVSY